MPEAVRQYFSATNIPAQALGLSDLEIPSITISTLKSAGYWDRLFVTVLWLDEAHEMGMASKLLRKLSSLLLPGADRSSLTFEEEQRLNQIIALLKIVALPTLKQRELEEVCRSGVVMALRAGLNLSSGIMNAYLFFDEPDLAAKFAQNVSRVLGVNMETIGSNMIVIEETGERLSPTVQNWLRSYNSAFRSDVVRGSVERSQYLQRDSNVKILAGSERVILTKLFEVYDVLRFPDLTPLEGEIEVPGSGLPKEPMKMDRAPLPQPGSVDEKGELVRGAYRGAAAVEQAIAREREKLIREISSDPRKLRAMFYSVVRARNISRTVAVLRLLVERDEMLSMLSGDEKLKHYLASVWPEMFGHAAAEEFMRNPNSRQSVQKFLQYLLQERLGLPVGEAARVGAQLSNAFKQRGKNEFQNLAYFDVQDQTFKWME